MAVIQFRSPVTKPLLHADEPLPADKTSVFRVTQQFDSRDFYWNDGRTHQATDIGDFQCGSPIVAMANGVATRVKDNASQIQAGATDALGVRIDHGQGYTTEYWHLGAYSIGVIANVLAGQQIGVVGNTGLGAVCHCHIEAKHNGVKFDPEPLMFGGSIGTPSTGDDPVYNPKDLLDLYGQQAVTRGSANLRAKQGVSYAILTTFPAGVTLTLVARVVGEPVNGNIEWFETKAELGSPSGQMIMTGFIHSSAVDLVPAAPTGITQAQLEAAENAGFTKAKAKARVASNAAIEAIAP